MTPSQGLIAAGSMFDGFYSGVYACLTLHTETKRYKGVFPSV